MPDLPQHQIITCGSKAAIHLSLSQPPKQKTHVSQNPDQIGTVFGSYRILTADRCYSEAWRQCTVFCQCLRCGSTKWVYLRSLQIGTAMGCRKCSRTRTVPAGLYKRFSAAKQRCENPRTRGWKNYGARGIEFRFSTVLEAATWMLATHGYPATGQEVDRIDNAGHYEAGNLRWASRSQNSFNTRRARMTEWVPADWPYARTVVLRLVAAGKTRAQILARAKTAVKDKRKNWRAIEEKLKSLT